VNQFVREPVVTQPATREPVVTQPATREPVTDQVARDTETINEILANRERAEKREMMENYIRTAAVIRDQAINRDPVVANISNEIFMTLVKQNQELRNTIAQERMIFRRIMEYIEAYKRGENPTVPN
jgi:TRAP-type mannitol/chloroaromatic compound transport system substrate-binding protein